MYDVVIVGGGPAGLSAALTLGRSRRRTLVCDMGEPRNAPSSAVHNFFSRDGIAPTELLHIGREQLRPYTTVEFCTTEVVSELKDGTRRTCRGLILASGIVDELPKLEGLAERWGKSVFHCLYCHGWEVRDQPIAVYGRGAMALHQTFLLTQLSRDIALCTDGPSDLTDTDHDRLAACGVSVRETRLMRLEGSGESLERLVFANGDVLERHALFVQPGLRQRSPLAEQLGCTFTEKGTVAVDEVKRTSVPGVYVVGDASLMAQAVIQAAADGMLAAAFMNHELVQADTRRLERE
jgi:thioredoxin reductase